MKYFYNIRFTANYFQMKCIFLLFSFFIYNFSNFASIFDYDHATKSKKHITFSQVGGFWYHCCHLLISNWTTLSLFIIKLGFCFHTRKEKESGEKEMYGRSKKKRREVIVDQKLSNLIIYKSSLNYFQMVKYFLKIT